MAIQRALDQQVPMMETHEASHLSEYFDSELSECESVGAEMEDVFEWFD